MMKLIIKIATIALLKWVILHDICFVIRITFFSDLTTPPGLVYELALAILQYDGKCTRASLNL